MGEMEGAAEGEQEEDDNESEGEEEEEEEEDGEEELGMEEAEAEEEEDAAAFASPAVVHAASTAADDVDTFNIRGMLSPADLADIRAAIASEDAAASGGAYRKRALTGGPRTRVYANHSAGCGATLWVEHFADPLGTGAPSAPQPLHFLDAQHELSSGRRRGLRRLAPGRRPDVRAEQRGRRAAEPDDLDR